MYEELTLDKETATKTDNDLIFIAEPINISNEEINKKIEEINAIIDNESDFKNLFQIIL